jgi:hypothetical protein
MNYYGKHITVNSGKTRKNADGLMFFALNYLLVPNILIHTHTHTQYTYLLMYV